MKAIRLHEYHRSPAYEDVPEPQVAGPWDVVVDIGAAGVCRTDLHVIEQQWQAIQQPQLPYILGHENAGWVRDVGDAVSNVRPGDPVIMHPSPVAVCASRAGSAMTPTASMRRSRV